MIIDTRKILGTLAIWPSLMMSVGCLEAELNQPALVFFSTDAGSLLHRAPERALSDIGGAMPQLESDAQVDPVASDRGLPSPVDDSAASPISREPDAEAPSPRDVPTHQCMSGRWALDINGRQRDVRIDVPQDWNGGPLLIALHGNGDTSDNFCRSSGVCTDGVARGALVATPDGPVREITVYNQRLRVAWNAYEPNANQNEDVAFLDAIANEATTRCNTQGTYVWGHSQGGYLAYLYAQVRGDSVWGAVISAAANPTPGRPWAATPSRPFYLLMGDQDPALPNARQSATELQQSGHRVNLNVLPGVGHGGHPRGYNDVILDFIWR